MITTYIGLGLVLLYTIIMIIINKSIPPSISETFYLGGKYWFTIILFISSFLIVAGLLEITAGSAFQFVSFLTGCGMAFVGAAPHFHDSEKTVHYAGATTLLAGSQLWLCLFSTPWTLLCWLFAPLWLFENKKMFWIEITAIVSVLIGLLFI